MFRGRSRGMAWTRGVEFLLGVDARRILEARRKRAAWKLGVGARRRIGFIKLIMSKLITWGNYNTIGIRSWGSGLGVEWASLRLMLTIIHSKNRQ
jgi:hypothetical protein